MAISGEGAVAVITFRPPAIGRQGLWASGRGGRQTLIGGSCGSGRLRLLPTSRPAARCARTKRGAPRTARGCCPQRTQPGPPTRVSVWTYVVDPDDPTVGNVALEDSAALIGLTLAAVGIGLHQVTGSAVWGGVAALLIGVPLIAVALTLASACERLLVGKQAGASLLEHVERRIETWPEVVDVVDVLSMAIGPGRVLLCTRVDVVNSLRAGEVEAQQRHQPRTSGRVRRTQCGLRPTRLASRRTDPARGAGALRAVDLGGRRGTVTSHTVGPRCRSRGVRLAQGHNAAPGVVALKAIGRPASASAAETLCRYRRAECLSRSQRISSTGQRVPGAAASLVSQVSRGHPSRSASAM